MAFRVLVACHLFIYYSLFSAIVRNSEKMARKVHYSLVFTRFSLPLAGRGSHVEVAVAARARMRKCAHSAWALHLPLARFWGTPGGAPHPA